MESNCSNIAHDINYSHDTARRHFEGVLLFTFQDEKDALDLAREKNYPDIVSLLTAHRGGDVRVPTLTHEVTIFNN